MPINSETLTCSGPDPVLEVMLTFRSYSLTIATILFVVLVLSRITGHSSLIYLISGLVFLIIGLIIPVVCEYREHRERKNAIEKIVEAVNERSKRVANFPSNSSFVTNELLSRMEGSRVEELSVDGSRITNDGLSTIGGWTNLRVLSLDETEITDRGLRWLNNLASLEELSIIRTKTTTLSGTELLTALKRLRASRTGLTDEGCNALEKFSEIEQLTLSHTKVTDQVCSTIAKLKHLKILDLSHNNISDKGIAELSSLKFLEILKVARTEVTIDAFKDLACRHSLKRVVIHRNQFSKEGEKQFGVWFPNADIFISEW